MKSHHQLVLLLLLLAAPASCFAEIADKTPTELQLWVQGIVFSLFAIVLGAWRAWLVVIPAVAALLLFGFFWADAQDPAFRAALEGELGTRYLVSAYAATVLPAAVAYAFFHFRRIARRGADDVSHLVGTYA